MNVNIYADEMLLINFAVNMAVILISKKILNKNTYIPTDILMSAAVALFSFFIVISPFRIYIKTFFSPMISIVMTIMLFRPNCITSFIKYIAVVKISSIFVNEAYLLLRYYFGGENLMLLFCGAALSYVLVILIKNIMKNSTYYHSVDIMNSDRIVSMTGLVDTGNSLVEPISKKPVIVAELNAVKSLLPEKFALRYIENDVDSFMEAVASIDDENFKKSIRVIPFSSIGNEKGIMLGFVADKAYIDGNSIHKPVIALYKKNLCASGLYNTLLSPRHIGGV